MVFPFTPVEGAVIFLAIKSGYGVVETSLFAVKLVLIFVELTFAAEAEPHNNNATIINIVKIITL
jgi:hypothetical protein